MEYEEFRNRVWNCLPQCVPEKYYGAEPINFPKKLDNGREKEGFTFIPAIRKNNEISFAPSYTYADLYNVFSRNKIADGELEGWIKSTMAALFAEAERISVMYGNSIVTPDAPQRVFFRMMNTEGNRSLLAGRPHREFMDLSVTYRLLIGWSMGGMRSVAISNEMARAIGMNESQLFEAAFVNTPRIVPFEIKWMEEYIDTEAVLEEHEIEEEDAPKMVAIGANSYDTGPSAFLYPEVLDKVAEMVGGDAYILPCSTHELLAVSADVFEPEHMDEMVMEVNMAQVAIEDRLSNRAYYYDSEARIIRPATDNPVPSVTELPEEINPDDFFIPYVVPAVDIWNSPVKKSLNQEMDVATPRVMQRGPKM